MYLTDVLDAAIMDRVDLANSECPEEYLREQITRMAPIIQRAIILEQVHREILPEIPFAWALLKYIDYLIYLNTTGPKN